MEEEHKAEEKEGKQRPCVMRGVAVTSVMRMRVTRAGSGRPC